VAAAVAVATAAPAGGAAAQVQQQRAEGDSARRTVDAMVARSEAFRDTVHGAIGDLRLDGGPSRASRFAQRLVGGLTFTVSQPVGEFRNFARAGFGITANGVAGLDPMGILGLRLEGGGQNYGRFSAPFQQGGLLIAIPARQVTSNDVFWGAIGPQVTLPLGPVRPYGFATVGIANFSTTSRLLGAGLDGRSQTFWQSTDLSNWSRTEAWGGGVRLRIAQQNATAVNLDLGAQRHYVRQARYLTPGAIPGQTGFNALSSLGRADFLTYHVGIAVGGR
jgi:hypothetical protein